VFLLAILIATLSVSGCAGVVSAPASVATDPAPPAAAQLTVNPSSISLTNTVGATASQSVTATNSGAASLSVNQVSITGTGFSMSGLTPPVSLSPGQSQNFTVMFDASTPGSVNGSLTIMTNASTSPVVVPLHGTGAASAPSVSSVTISPSTASAIVGSTLPFSATVQGTTSNTAVTWAATRGTITSAGVYTAPATTGADTVTATSVADTAKSASAAITVIAAPSNPVVTSVTISPAAASALTGATVQFSASVQGTVTDKSISWKAALGTITSAGLYTAPASAGTDTVTATSNADTTKSASAPVTVTAPPVVTSVSVSPSPASTITGGTIQFTASVAGTVTNTSVTWKAALGTITSAGLYTAPATPGTDTVTATSVADTTKSGTSTVTVSTPVVNSVSVSPSPASTITGGAIQFTATVAGTVTNKSVTWTAALGTITSAGLYTAPASAGTDTVTATSVADTTKSGTSTVTVSTPVVNSVSVSPTSTSTTTGGTLQFTATVTGTVTNKSVTWTAALGTITGGGVYTAPSSAGTATVTATSNADTTKSGTATVTISAPQQNGALPAFPGAQGGGAAAVGGRGGQVMEVTNLNDSGSGSLRDCVEASGPRTCVFRVAGIITPASRLSVSNPFLTIACQTAPGEIIIGGPNIAGESLFISTNDVIVRYCTFSADNINVAAGPDTGTMNIEIANGDNYNIVLDHVTTRWAGNKLWLTLSNYVGPNRLITTQWSMFYEPNANHPVGPGNSTNPDCVATSSSPCFSSGEHDIDFHHNLFANIGHRIPESTNYSTRFVNNVVFNWDYYASEWLGAMTVDEIGNKYVAGNLNSGAQAHEIHFTSISPSLPGNPSAYLSGNIGPNQSDPSGDQYLMAAQIDGENGDEQGPLPSSWIRSSPMPPPAFPISADAVGNLDNVLLGTVGNSQHLDCNGNWVSHRDPADQRVINQYQTGGAGAYWPNGITVDSSTPVSLPTPTSLWTDQPVTNFPVCMESLHDGIPDQWKSAQGLSTTDPNLYNEIAPNGYTYLENYMNGPGGSASLKPNTKRSTWAAKRPASDAATASRSSRAADTATATSRGTRAAEENPSAGGGHF